MLIDNYIPEPDAVERHSISIEAPAATVYRALKKLDLRNLTPVRLLFAIRGLPSFLSGRKTRQVNTGAMTLESLTKIGFVVLAEEPETQIVLGVTGRFWHPVDNIAPYPKESFGAPIPRGMARAAWDFCIEERETVSILTTETRILCADRSSRRKFRAYWLLVRPFSGLIRILMLRSVKSSCEGSNRDLRS